MYGTYTHAQTVTYFYRYDTKGSVRDRRCISIATVRRKEVSVFVVGIWNSELVVAPRTSTAADKIGR